MARCRREGNSVKKEICFMLCRPGLGFSEGPFGAHFWYKSEPESGTSRTLMQLALIDTTSCLLW